MKRKVYVVKFHENIIGVYSSRKLAKEYGEQECYSRFGTDWCSICEWIINGNEIYNGKELPQNVPAIIK